MRVLVLAPQPFYQERGTPIAVRLAVESLAKRLTQDAAQQHPPIDLMVYNEGEDISIPGVRIIRVKTPSWLRGVRPGISLKKLLCDILLAFQAITLLIRSRHNQYDVIHAVEESVFIAWCAKRAFGIPYIYDMDSSLALQLTEKWWWCKPLLFLLQYLEGIAIRSSISVAPVCDALQAIAQRQGSGSTIMLRDVSLLPNSRDDESDRHTLFGPGISNLHQIILYVGNLETYQGIDLLLESFARIHTDHAAARLVIVGGTTQTIERYKAKAAALGCAERTLFTGPRPVHQLALLLKAADILVSPRITGNNTPMKVYSYLHSGTALLATDLPTHQQILNDSLCVLAAPEPAAFGDAMGTLLDDELLRKKLGAAAQSTAEKLYTVQAFEAQLGKLYDVVETRLKGSSTRESQQVQNQ
jgi:glycosyltransferase involved in cell wall biosynthesis